MMTDNELIQKSTKHYLGWCDRNGYRADRPSVDASEVNEGVIYLRNHRGELARYKYNNNDQSVRKLIVK